MLNCLIIDDEPLARQHIANHISRIGDLKLVGSARNPALGKSILDKEDVDIIFLDIKMREQNGLDFIRKNKPGQQVVVISAYPEYAIDGFELEVTDYLMKPVTFERFSKAIERVKARIGQPQPGFIYVKHKNQYEKLLLSDIIYIESKLNYVRISTETRKYTIYSSLKNILSGLPDDQFIRIHKSYIVAISRISSVSANCCCIGNIRLPVSRANKKKLMEKVL